MEKPRYATAALLVSIGAMATCCAPVGLVGVLLGVLSLQSAKKLGAPRPWAAVAGIVLGVLSVGEMIGTVMWYRADQAARQGQATKAMARAEAGRGAETLSQDTACALAEAYLLQHHAASAKQVVCEGSLDSAGKLASLDAVKLGDTQSFTVCFARVDKWYAGAALTFGSCPTEVSGLDALPQGPEPERAKAVRQAFTDTLRDSQRREFAVLMKSLVMAAERGSDEAPETCPPLASGEAQVLDAELVSDDGELVPAQKGWGFLTTGAVRDAAEKDATLDDLQKAGEHMGKYAVVVISDNRELPRSAGRSSFDAGYLDGILVVVEVAKAEPLCATEFSFESSESIETTRVGLKLGPKVNVGGDLGADFKKNYKKAVRAALSRLTDDKVSADLPVF